MEQLAQIGSVSHLRGHDQDELVRTAGLAELHECDGAISYLKVSGRWFRLTTGFGAAGAGAVVLCCVVMRVVFGT